jgi:hypothetical protein
MFRWLVLCVFSLGSLLLAGQARAAALPKPKACELPKEDLGLRKEDEAWSTCEKFAWSCIRRGMEANLYEKACLVPRSAESNQARDRAKYAPFVDPNAYAAHNLLGDQFLRAVLWQEHYTKQIPPHGVRIFGAYFEEPVNLENITTTANLVLDGSVFKKGLRLTNFRSPMNISLDGSNVRGSILMLRTRIDGSLFLQKGVYDTVDLRDARIGSSIDAARSVFTDDFRMDRARIEGKVNLVKSRLTMLNAWDTSIGGSLELRLADIRVRVDMTGASVAGDVRLQRVAFGRKKPGQVPSCDWDTATPGDHLLSELNVTFKDEPDTLRRIIDETVLSRSSSASDYNICEELLKDARIGAKNEMLLRDMRIKGNLCLIDLTGEIPSTGPPEHLDVISLDGTQASSTVLRWKESASQTLWRAVNFKTNYMLINLESQPLRHFIDNMDVGFVAFVKKDANEPSMEGDDNVDKYLCDVTPAPGNVMPAGSRNVHERLVRFFAGPGNESRSAQPFSKVVERLEESGATSTYLKTRLSEYRLARVCTTSAVSKELSTLEDLGVLNFPRSLMQAWRKAQESNEIGYNTVGETNRLFWDGICSGGMMVYKYAVSYGHEPYNLFYYALIFIGLFWLLLKLDKRPGPEAGPKLGLTYAVDTFVPLAQLRLDRRNAGALPNRGLLRLYLRFHRFTGLVFAVLVFLFIYRVAK